MSDIKIRIGNLTDEEMEKLRAEKPKQALDDPHIRKIIESISKGETPNDFLSQLGHPYIPRHSPILDILKEERQRTAQLQQPPSGKKQKLAREDQITKERCQTAAKLLWKDNPGLTIADVAKHPNVYNTDITGGRRYDLRTVRDWVAEVFPKHQKKQVGRPPKKLK